MLVENNKLIDLESDINGNNQSIETKLNKFNPLCMRIKILRQVWLSKKNNTSMKKFVYDNKILSIDISGQVHVSF